MFCGFTPPCFLGDIKRLLQDRQCTTTRISNQSLDIFVMIKPEDRFYSGGQGYVGSRDNSQTETYCNVWDWDQLQLIKVKGTAKLFPPDEDIENSVLARFADYLSPKVRAITVDDDGLLTGVSTNPEEDGRGWNILHWIYSLLTLPIACALCYNLLLSTSRAWSAWTRCGSLII